MICWGKRLFERRLISGWGGNLSCRVGKNRFLITGQHTPLPFLTPADLVRIDQDGRPATKERKASSETPMHMAVYAGTDAQAIIHVHPPMVLAFSLTHESFRPISFEEKYTRRGPDRAAGYADGNQARESRRGTEISSDRNHQGPRHGGNW